MELLLATAVKWWDRHDSLNEMRLTGWYKKVVKRFGMDGLVLREEGFPINAIDMPFFFGDEPFSPHAAAVNTDIFHYERLFLHYKNQMERYNEKHRQLLNLIKASGVAYPTVELLEHLFKENPKLKHRFIVDDFQESLRSFLGFNRLILTEINVYQQPWFVEKIRTNPQPSQLFKHQWTGGTIEYCKTIDRLFKLEDDIRSFRKSLLTGFKVNGKPGIYIRYTEPYYSRSNNQLFYLLENGVHQLKMAMIRYMRHAMDRSTNILVGETSDRRQPDDEDE